MSSLSDHSLLVFWERISGYDVYCICVELALLKQRDLGLNVFGMWKIRKSNDRLDSTSNCVLSEV